MPFRTGHLASLRRAALLTPLCFAPVCPTQAAAASDDASTARLESQTETILVTARRRLEDAQKVPGGLAVVTAADLTRSYSVNTQAISTLVPALNYNSANPRNTSFTIRGLGSSVVAVAQANDGLESGVAFYMDEVYTGRPAAAAFDFTDIERIEVLKGPQGTLYGKNSTSGAIHVISKQPSFTPEAQAELSVGGSGFRQAKAALSGALMGDKLAARVSGAITRRDGSIRNVATGARLNNTHTDAVRGQLLWRPADSFTLRLIADWSNFDATCCTQVFVRIGQTQRPPARRFAALAAGINYQPPSTNPYDRLSDIDSALLVDTNQGGVTAIAEWDAGEVAVTSVSAWRFWNWTAANDRDFTGVPVQLVQRIPSRQDQFSQELRIATTGAGPFKAIGGLYVFSQKVVGRPETVYGPRATYWLLGSGPAFPASLLDGYSSTGRTDFRSTSYAVFGEASYQLLERLTLTGGLRYTWEDKWGDYQTRVFGGLANPTAAQRTQQLSILRPQSYRATVADGSLSGRANVAFDLSDEIMAFAGFARGFKSGGINMAGLPLDAANQPALPTAVIKPERNTSVEVGLKSKWLDGRLLLNLTGYLTDVTDFQANVVDTGPGALRGYLANIPKVTVRGVEADAAMALTSAISLRGGVAYTRGRYADYRNGPCPLERIAGGAQVCDLSGRPLPNLPRLAVSAGLAVTYPLEIRGQEGAFLLNIDSVSRTSVSGDGPASRDLFIKGYSLVNASIGVSFASGWELRLFARNLFDANYLQNVTAQAGNSGLIVGTPSEPRLIGVSLRFAL
jgi:iron complex outermembrane recepter protein